MIKAREPVTKKVTKPVTPEVTMSDYPLGQFANLLAAEQMACEKCPTCGHRLKAHPDAAAKQRAYRERKKERQ